MHIGGFLSLWAPNPQEGAAASADNHMPPHPEGTLLPPQQGPPRKTLVLDLDRTLIDCIIFREPSSEPDFVYTDELGTQAKVWKRPFLQQFLAAVARDFEVVLFTAAGARHADSVLRYIDPKCEVFTYRLYGQHTSESAQWGWVKDLSRLGRPLSSTLIVDDSMLAALRQPCNLVPIRPFEHTDPNRVNDTALVEVLRFLQDKVLPAEDVRDAIAAHWNKRTRRPRRHPLHAACINTPPPPATLSDCTCGKHAAHSSVLCSTPPTILLPAPHQFVRGGFDSNTGTWRCAAAAEGCGCTAGPDGYLQLSQALHYLWATVELSEEDVQSPVVDSLHNTAAPHAANSAAVCSKCGGRVQASCMREFSSEPVPTLATSSTTVGAIVAATLVRSPSVHSCLSLMGGSDEATSSGAVTSAAAAGGSSVKSSLHRPPALVIGDPLAEAVFGSSTSTTPSLAASDTPTPSQSRASRRSTGGGSAASTPAGAGGVLFIPSMTRFSSASFSGGAASAGGAHGSVDLEAMLDGIMDRQSLSTPGIANGRSSLQSAPAPVDVAAVVRELDLALAATIAGDDEQQEEDSSSGCWDGTGAAGADGEPCSEESNSTVPVSEDDSSAEHSSSSRSSSCSLHLESMASNASSQACTLSSSATSVSRTSSASGSTTATPMSSLMEDLAACCVAPTQRALMHGVASLHQLLDWAAVTPQPQAAAAAKSVCHKQ